MCDGGDRYVGGRGERETGDGVGRRGSLRRRRVRAWGDGGRGRGGRVRC